MTMRTDCRHYESRTYGNGEAVHFGLNLAGIDILAEEDRKSKRKLFRKIPKKRKRR